MPGGRCLDSAPPASRSLTRDDLWEESPKDYEKKELHRHKNNSTETVQSTDKYF